MPKLSARQIAGLVKLHGATPGGGFQTGLRNPDTDGPIFVAIAMAESGGDTDAVNDKNTNGTKDYGLWQINSVHRELLASYNWKDPLKNFTMAISLYRGRGYKFNDWSTYNYGKYAAFMGEAAAAWANPDDSAAQGNAIGEAVNDTADAVNALPDFLNAITKPETWVRIGMGVAGALLLIITAVAMFKQQALKVATKAVTKKIGLPTKAA